MKRETARITIWMRETILAFLLSKAFESEFNYESEKIRLRVEVERKRCLELV